MFRAIRKLKYIIVIQRFSYLNFQFRIINRKNNDFPTGHSISTMKSKYVLMKLYFLNEIRS